jgi:dienelactone hydrolase
MQVQKKLISIVASIVLAALPMAHIGAQGVDARADSSKPDPYAIGHISYTLCCTDFGRSVAVSVFYPVDRHTIKATTPQAQYQLDPFSNNLPITTSAQWESLGLARAYEGPRPSDDGPFPLVIVTPAYTGDHWQYIFLGTALASHGFVVAVTDHPDEGQWPWSNFNDYMVTLFNRTHDLPFAVTQLLEKNSTSQELLHGTMDAEKIAMIGHSLGGNAAYALAAGYDDFCDEVWASNFYGDPTTEPSFICNPLSPDRRIHAIVGMDGASMTLRYANLAKVHVPSLILGETVANSATIPVGATTWLYRAHAAIDRSDSFRVEILGSNHYSFTNYCQAGPLFLQLGVLQILYEGGFLPGNTLAAWYSVFPCAGPAEATFDPVTIDPATAQRIVDRYMRAFLDTYIRQDPTQDWLLTPQFAREHEPLVYFYDSEKCTANLPSEQFYTYHPIPGQCAVAQKDPPEFFAP